jgi:MerR family copper efflux transcriptional regulator
MVEPMRIGKFAERAGLSLRTIRHFDTVGLVTPSGHTPGGFRLYTEDDLARILLVKDMKPLGLTIDEMRALLTLLDRLDEDDISAAERVTLVEQLDAYRIAAEARSEALMAQIRRAQSLSTALRERLDEHRKARARAAGSNQ